MASNYPTSLDNFTNPTSNDSLNSPSHSLQHANINDAVEAIEAKLGIGASPAGSATSGHVLTAGTGGTTTWSAPALSGLVPVIPTSVSVSAGTGSFNSTTGLVTFSGSGVTRINGVFSSAYNNYYVQIEGTASADQFVYLRLSSSGSDYTGTGYSTALRYFASDAGVGFDQNSSTTSTPYIASFRTDESSAVQLVLFSPNVARITKIQGDAQYGASTVMVRQKLGMKIDTTTQYDGFSITANSGGTLSGRLKVYGYN